MNTIYCALEGFGGSLCHYKDCHMLCWLSMGSVLSQHLWSTFTVTLELLRGI